MTDAVGTLEQHVRETLEELRPALQMDGGDVEFVALHDGVAQVRLLGACGGCPMATMTLVGFVEERLKQRIPEIQRVESV
ncbi:MAG TPA: NifU family protein [Thermoanaerobaculaceae bacterium]|nr:NifU family protein [Thermoanaerobaculaceae bacterium]